MNDIRITQNIWEKTINHLFQDDNEHVAFFLAESIHSKGIKFLVKDVILVKDEDMECGGFSAQVKVRALLEVTNKANKDKLALIEIHNHNFSFGDVDFSRTDYNGFKEFVPYIFDVLPGRPYAAIVVTPQEEVNAIVWRKTDNFEPISHLHIVGSNFNKYATTLEKRIKPRSITRPSTHSRQIMAFGKEGQEKIQSVRVAIVGCGGIGSHISQQLAYLGVRDFYLIDPDVVEDTNLNRLVGASESDVGKPKVHLMARMISTITNGKAEVRTMQKNLRSSESFEALKQSDIIFGCVDNDGARLILNQLSFSYLTHYVDCATGIDTEDGKLDCAGGHVMVLQPEGPCMECANMIDKKEASDNLTSPEDYENRKKLGYVKNADIPNASVVSLNGIIASIAVNEFMMLVTSIRPPRLLTVYDLLQGREPTTVQRTIKKDETCIHNFFVGIGDKVHLERYLRNEVIL